MDQFRVKADYFGSCTRWLSILWAGLGAVGSGYIFFLSTHLPAIPSYSHIPSWVGESSVIIGAAELAALAWLLLTIPVLIAGLIRLRAAGYRAAAWTGAWAVGIALMVVLANWQTSAPTTVACSGNSGCVLTGYSHVVVSWVELPIAIAFVALGAMMTWMLAGRPDRSAEH